MSHRYSIATAALAIVAMLGFWAYFIFVVPNPSDIIEARDARFKRQWERINENTADRAALEQRLDSFEAEMRRSVNPEAWIARALMRQEIADIKADVEFLKNASAIDNRTQ